MALFSQCFAISAVVAPLLGGALLDQQGHGLLLWLGMAVACLAMLPTAYQLRPRFDSSGSRDHLVDAVAGNPGPLGG